MGFSSFLLIFISSSQITSLGDLGRLCHLRGYIAYGYFLLEFSSSNTHSTLEKVNSPSPTAPVTNVVTRVCSRESHACRYLHNTGARTKTSKETSRVVREGSGALPDVLVEKMARGVSDLGHILERYLRMRAQPRLINIR